MSSSITDLVSTFHSNVEMEDTEAQAIADLVVQHLIDGTAPTESPVVTRPKVACDGLSSDTFFVDYPDEDEFFDGVAEADLEATAIKFQEALDSEDERYLAARKVCGSCPAQIECLMWGTLTEQWGVYGGYTMNARERILYLARQEVPEEVQVAISQAS